MRALHGGSARPQARVSASRSRSCALHASSCTLRRQLDDTAPELRRAVVHVTLGAGDTRLRTPPVAHYRFPHPVQKDRRLTGSKSKKVIRLWQAEVAREEVRARRIALLSNALCAHTPRPLLRAQVLRVRDELFLLLRLRPRGVLLDDLWPALRRMVLSRPGGFTPVTSCRLDKPDRTFQKIIDTAGYKNVKAFLAEQPEVTLTVRAVSGWGGRWPPDEQGALHLTRLPSTLTPGRGVTRCGDPDTGVPGRADAAASAARCREKH
jgi:hypothetical protein